MASADERYNKLIEIFKGEFKQRITLIQENLDSLKTQNPTANTEQLVQSIASESRNIKVSAQAVEFDYIVEMAHRLEQLFSGIQQDLSLLSAEIIVGSQEIIAYLKEAMEACSQGESLPDGYQTFMLKLKQWLDNKKESSLKEPVAGMGQAKTPVHTITKVGQDFAKQIVNTFKIELDEKCQVITDGLLKLERIEQDSSEYEATIHDMFRAAHNIKGSARGVGILPVGDIAHRLETLFSSLQKHVVRVSKPIITLCLAAVDAMQVAMGCFLKSQPLSFELPELLASLEQYASGDSKLPQEAPVIRKPAISPAKVSSAKHEEVEESIRVSLKNLEHVSAYMEDMLVNKIAFDDHYAQLSRINVRMRQFMKSWKKELTNLVSTSLINPASSQAVSLLEMSDELMEFTHSLQELQKDMRARMNELAVTFNNLQDEVSMLRLVPVSILLRTLPRVVRDLALSLNKEVNLTIADNEVKIDKLVLEGLKDPLHHILRNAIDHGIEPVEKRVQQGKPEIASIAIDVHQEGSQIVFVIKDDGAGIDLDKIARIALQENLITQAELENMTEQTILELIFHPGFSTAETITDISGRGVGLDVVRTNLAALKGNVTVTSKQGQGTTFYLHVPLTLATERGLIVRSDNQFFAITVDCVLRVLLIRQGDIHEIENSRAILLDDKFPINLYALTTILNPEKTWVPQSDLLQIVLVKKNLHTVALVMDEVLGESEIVIKPLQAPLTNTPCIAGATLSGNGQIIFVLNSIELIEKSLQAPTIPSIKDFTEMNS